MRQEALGWESEGITLEKARVELARFTTLGGFAPHLNSSHPTKLVIKSYLIATWYDKLILSMVPQGAKVAE